MGLWDLNLLACLFHSILLSIPSTEQQSVSKRLRHFARKTYQIVTGIRCERKQISVSSVRDEFSSEASKYVSLAMRCTCGSWSLAADLCFTWTTSLLHSSAYGYVEHVLISYVRTYLSACLLACVHNPITSRDANRCVDSSIVPIYSCQG